jgi:hypothetical protein
MHEQTPEKVPAYERAGFNQTEELRQWGSGSYISGPVVFSNDVRFVYGLDETDVALELRIVRWVEVIREDVDSGDGEMRCIDTVGTVNNKFGGGKLLDI